MVRRSLPLMVLAVSQFGVLADLLKDIKLDKIIQPLTKNNGADFAKEVEHAAQEIKGIADDLKDKVSDVGAQAPDIVKDSSELEHAAKALAKVGAKLGNIDAQKAAETVIDRGNSILGEVAKSDNKTAKPEKKPEKESAEVKSVAKGSAPTPKKQNPVSNVTSSIGTDLQKGAKKVMEGPNTTQAQSGNTTAEPTEERHPSTNDVDLGAANVFDMTGMVGAVAVGVSVTMGYALYSRFTSTSRSPILLSDSLDSFGQPEGNVISVSTGHSEPYFTRF